MSEEKEAPQKEQAKEPGFFSKVLNAGPDLMYKRVCHLCAEQMGAWIDQNNITPDAIEQMIAHDIQPILDLLSQADEAALTVAKRIIPVIEKRVSNNTYMQILDLLQRTHPQHVSVIKRTTHSLVWYGKQMKRVFDVFSGKA